jgi:hypothetical protein
MPVKIGKAAAVKERLLDLQTGHPWPLKVLFSVEVGPDLVSKAETACHRLLKEKKTYGEWFDLDPQHATEAVRRVLDERLWERKKKKPGRKPGQASSKARKVSIAFRTTPTLRAEAERLAKEQDVTVSRLVERLIRDIAIKRGFMMAA